METTRRRILRAGMGVAAIAGLDALAEPRFLETVRHEATLPNLPAERDGLKVALLTDLHRGPVTADETIAEAVARTMAWEPDLIALTGDFILGAGDHVGPCARLLAPLRAPLGIWGCLGNHDYRPGGEEVAGALERIGVRMLRNGSGKAADGLYVAGIEDTLRGFPDADAALAGVPDDAALLFLTHNPVGVQLVRDRPCVALSGHTHGGQVRVPGLPPHFPPGMKGFPLIARWGRFGGALLYISRGVGQTGLPARLCCRPELTLLRLRAG